MITDKRNEIPCIFKQIYYKLGLIFNVERERGPVLLEQISFNAIIPNTNAF